MRSYDVEMVPTDNGPWCLKSEADNELRHQKYKRCVAMAKICECRTAYTCGRRLRHNLIWFDRWLKFAEQFKEEA